MAPKARRRRHAPHATHKRGGAPCIVAASTLGDVDAVESLLKRRDVDPAASQNAAIKAAAAGNHAPVLRLLCRDPRVNVAANSNAVLLSAAEAGATDAVRFLLGQPRVDPGARRNAALRAAAWHGHVAIVQLLLRHPRVDPMVSHELVDASGAPGETFPQPANALVVAAFRGHVPVIEVLLADPRVDPAHGGNAAVTAAACGGNAAAVQYLLANARVASAPVHRGLAATAARLGHASAVQALEAAARGFPGLLRALLPHEAVLAVLERWWTRCVCANGLALTMAEENHRCLTGTRELRSALQPPVCVHEVASLLHDARLSGAHLRARAFVVLDDALVRGNRDLAALVLGHPRLDEADAVAYALHHGSECRLVTVLEALVSNSAHVALLCTQQLQTAVLRAASRGDQAVVQVLVRHPSVSVARVLRAACHAGVSSIVTGLLADEELVGRLDFHLGNEAEVGSALVAAAAHRDPSMLSMLLRAGPFTRAHAADALDTATDRGGARCVQVLLSDTRFDYFAEHALVIDRAIKSPDEDVLRVLLADDRLCPVACRSLAAAGHAKDARANALLVAYSRALHECARNGRVKATALILDCVALTPAACDKVLMAVVRHRNARRRRVAWALVCDGRADPGILVRAAQWGDMDDVRVLLPACEAACRWRCRRMWLRCG
jgi:hypothetical protein